MSPEQVIIERTRSMYGFSEERARQAGFEPLGPPVPGGHGTVIKARPLGGGHLVALKSPGASRSPLGIRREADALRRLDHPGIATLVAAGESAGAPYLATRWIDGETLRRHIDRVRRRTGSGLSVERALCIGASLAAALAHAHKAGVVHGDLTPNNVLIDPAGRPTLIDFDSGGLSSTITLGCEHDIAGTPTYLAPERIAGQPASPSGDLYALALIVHEMLTGEWAFGDPACTVATALHHQLYGSPLPLGEARPDLPAAMDAVLARALAKQAGDRHADPHAFVAALRSAADRAPVRARRLAPGLRLGFGGALAVGVASVSPALTSPDEAPTASTLAASAPCNLYANATFDDSLAPNFYRDAARESLAVRSPATSADDSPVLTVGDVGRYGQYGVIVEIVAGQRYAFAADVTLTGEIDRAELIVLWLDRAWRTIDGATVTRPIDAGAGGSVILPSIEAPPGARYAVPTLFKDASRGLLHADNITFAAHDDDCR